MWEREGSSIDKEKNKQESLLGTGLRTAARTAARVGETVAGLPGDIASLGLTGLDIAGKGLGNALGVEEWKKTDTSNLRKYLPTSENIREHVTGNIEKLLPEDYLTAQSETEKKLDDFTETFASLLTFGGPVAKGTSYLGKAAKAAGIAGGAELGKWATESVTGSESLGSGVKLGTILLGSMAGGRKQLEKQAESLYGTVDKIIADGSAKVHIGDTLGKEAKSVLKNIGGIESPSKKIVKDLGGDLLKAVVGKESMSLKDLVDADQVLNEILRTNYDTLSANKTSLKRMYDLKSGIEGAIKSSEGAYPEFYKSYTEAKDIWRGLNATDSIRHGLESVAKGEHFKSPLTTYFILKSPSKIVKYGLGAAAGKALSYPYKVFKSFSSPYVRTHYKNMVKAGAQGKFQIALKELRKVDDALYKENPEDSNGTWEK